MAGFCERVDITLSADGWISVIDNGRGIPIGKHDDQSKKQGKEVSAAEVVMSVPPSFRPLLPS